MFVDKPSGDLGPWRVYAFSIGLCIVFIGLAGLAFQISTDAVGPASAYPEATGPAPAYPEGTPYRAGGVLRSLKAVARMAALPLGRVAKPAGPSEAPAGPTEVIANPPPSELVLISRAPIDGKTGAADVDEANASPDADEWTSVQQWSPDRSDTFRTVCVRLCDGAFFPISFATTRDRFKGDAARCKAGCGTPARLFVGPPDGTMEDLADVKGHAYSALPNAFKFRVGYDAACSCKGQPWEDAERERHKAFADAPRVAALLPVKPVEVVASPLPLTLSRVARTVEVAALHSTQAPRTIPAVPPGRLQPVKPVSVAVAGSVAAAMPTLDAGEHKKPRKVARASTGKVSTKSRVAAVRKRADPFQIVMGPPLKASRAPVWTADTSMQRPFKPNEYWRLSYWEVRN